MVKFRAMKIWLLAGLLALSLNLAAHSRKQLAWQTGTLVEQRTSQEDAGCAGQVCGGTITRYHYSITTENKLYVANRRGDRLKIVVNAPIRFAVDGDALYLVDVNGKVHECHLEEERNTTPH